MKNCMLIERVPLCKKHVPLQHCTVGPEAGCVCLSSALNPLLGDNTSLVVVYFYIIPRNQYKIVSISNCRLFIYKLKHGGHHDREESKKYYSYLGLSLIKHVRKVYFVIFNIIVSDRTKFTLVKGSRM